MKTEFAVSKRMTAFVFVAIVFLFIAAAICFFFFDGYVIRWFYQVGINCQSSRAVKILQYLGKTWLLAWLILFWGIVTRRNQPITIALLTFLAVGAIVLPLKLLVHRKDLEILSKESMNKKKKTASCSFEELVIPVR